MQNETAPAPESMSWLASLIFGGRPAQATGPYSQGMFDHQSYQLLVFNDEQDSLDDIAIAMMGPTGAGKSTFIKMITGRNEIRIGHELTSGVSKSLLWSALNNALKSNRDPRVQGLSVPRWRHSLRTYRHPRVQRHIPR